MNLSLLDESTCVWRRYPMRYGSYDCVRAVKRGVIWLSSTLWRKSVLTITACYKSSTASARSSSLMRYHQHYNELDYEYRPQQPTLLQPYSGLLSTAYDEDTVVVKVGILGDCQTGKTSLMENYVVGDRSSDHCLQSNGISSMDKIFDIHSAKIAMSIWELGEYRNLMTPAVCNDAAAIIILFDLTRRTTLHSVKQWFVLARQCNQVALPVLVGTKFDQFIKMPESIRSLIIKQARLYAQAMGAPLLFTSIPYNINVNKVFKIVLARIFDLPCNISRNLNPGEPLVEY